MGSQLSIGNNKQELRLHGSFDFPFSISKVCISRYRDRRFELHWHSDPELTVILDGEISYQVNNQIYKLKKGQAIYVNSNCLHSAWNKDGDCLYMPCNFDPYAILGNDEEGRIRKKYIEPILSSSVFASLVFDGNSSESDKKIIDLLVKVYDISKSKDIAYELSIVSAISDIWSVISPRALEVIEESGDIRSTKQVLRMKNAIDYVENKYNEPIILSDLASACGLSRSELCRCFKSIMHQSPMEYVSSVRIRKALPLLASKENTVTEIAEMCGFSGSSYFAETFKRYMKCTPSQYAKKESDDKNK